MEKHGRGKTPFFLTFFSTIPVDAFFLTLQGLFPLFHIFLHYGYLLLKTFYFFFFEKKILHIPKPAGLYPLSFTGGQSPGTPP